jgi:DNA invertase Pin-like site-specific DNA recombinase
MGSAQTPSTKTRRAVGVVRVSRIDEDEVDRAVSPDEQRVRISDACERDSLELVTTFNEPNVSGGAPLERRPGLSQAIAMIEAGDADVVVVAYFDRLVRSLAVQAEIVSRVEAAGGGILAVDVGEVTNGSAGQWLSGNVLGLVAEYQRRTTAERTQEAKRRAIARGVPTFDRIPPGYRQREDRTLERDPETAPIVQEAFRLRAQGAGIKDVQAFMHEHGIERTFTSTQTMLASRIYLGELHFGALENLSSHEPLIDVALFRRVQNLVVPRGRKAKSERLLARLGVLRCGTCGARMVVGTTRANGRDYGMYRCPPNSDCPRRVTISAEIVERAVIDAVRDRVDGMQGSATMEDGVAEAEHDLELREQELSAAVRAFTGLEDVEATRDRLLELRDARDGARDRLGELQAAIVPAVTVSAGDWDSLSLDGRRALVRAVLDRVVVAPGRGAARITIEPRY